MPSESITILAETATQILIRAERAVSIGNKKYRGVRHEWWTDKAAYARGEVCAVNDEGEALIYCQGYAGVSEAELVARFKREAN